MSSGVPRIKRASNVPRPPHPVMNVASLSLAPKTRPADAAVHAAIPAFIDFFTKSRRSIVGPCRSGISRSCYRQQDIINSLQMPTARLRIGFVACVHPFYDLPPVARQRQDAIEELRSAGCEGIAPGIPRTAADAVEIAARLRDSAIDVVLLFFCTWVAEEITLTLAGELRDVPLLIWALPYLEKDIPMPSPISGLVASGSNIRRSGKRFVWLVGQVTPGQVRQVVCAARAGKVAGSLRRGRVGMVGAAGAGRSRWTKATSRRFWARKPSTSAWTLCSKPRRRHPPPRPRRPRSASSLKPAAQETSARRRWRRTFACILVFGNWCGETTSTPTASAAGRSCATCTRSRLAWRMP